MIDLYRKIRQHKNFIEIFTTLVTVGLRGLTLVSKFILILVLARFFEPAEVGLFGMMTAGLAFTLLLFGMEFYAFAVREMVTASSERLVSMLRDTYLLYAIGYVFFLPITGLAFYLGLLPIEIIGWFYALVVFEHLSHEMTRILAAISRPIASNLLLFIRAGAWVYVIVSAMFFVEDWREMDAVFGAWWGGVVSSLAIAMWLLRKMPWREGLKRPIDWPWVKLGFRRVRPFIITAFSALGVSFIDRFFLQAYEGLAMVGIYSFYAGVTTAMHSLVHTGVSVIRMPRLVSAWDSGDKNKFRQEMVSMGMVNFGATALVIAIAAVLILPVVGFVGRDDYSDYLSVYYILLAAAALRCLAEVPLYRLYSQHRDWMLLVVNLSGFLVVVLGNMILVPRMGGAGAAWAATGGSLMLYLAAWGVPMLRDAQVKLSKKVVV